MPEDSESGSTQSKSTSSSGGTNWLAVANLILTAVIGIGLALYFNSRNESLQFLLQERNDDLQRSLISLGAEVTGPASLAHLSEKRICCDTSVMLENAGPAIARNVRSVIYVDSISPSWSPWIDDLSQFSIKHFPPSVRMSIQPVHVDTPDNDPAWEGNNAIEIELDSLPPKGNFYVTITLSNSVPATITQSVRQTTVSMTGPDADHIQSGGFWMFKNFLDERYKIISASVTSICDNCEGNSPGLTFPVSSVQSWGYDNIETQMTSDAITETGTLTVDYLLPIGTTPSEPASTMHLRGYGLDGAGVPHLQELRQD